MNSHSSNSAESIPADDVLSLRGYTCVVLWRRSLFVIHITNAIRGISLKDTINHAAVEDHDVVDIYRFYVVEDESDATNNMFDGVADCDSEFLRLVRLFFV